MGSMATCELSRDWDWIVLFSGRTDSTNDCKSQTFGNSLWTDGDATKFGFGAFSFNYWCNKAASELGFAVGIS